MDGFRDHSIMMFIFLTADAKDRMMVGHLVQSGVTGSQGAK